MCECPCETNEFKLLVGKTYLNRKGEKVLVLYDRGSEYTNPHSRLICVELKNKYTSSRSLIGRYMADSTSDSDLIKEYSDEDERKEKVQKYIDYVKSLKVDDPVEVRDSGMYFIKRHFDKVGSYGFICFDTGMTSYTTAETADWEIIKHPDGTEIKFEDIEKWL